MKQFFVMIWFLCAVGYASAETDVELAKDARALLWAQSSVGRGSEEVCKTVEQPPKVTRKGKVVRPPKTVCKTVTWDNVLLAIKQPMYDFKLVKARMDTCASLTPGIEVTCVRNYLGNTNGLNTHFVVTHQYGYKVYAIRRLGNTPFGRQEMVYSPYSDELKTPTVIEEGKKYLDHVLDEAIEKLRERGVKSLSFPGKLVADVAKKETLHNLALIEHIDVERFKSENIKDLMDEVYVTLALNKGGAYSLAPSTASANGLFQIIPKTYYAMLITYPRARLMINYHSGVHDHVNAAMASFLLMDHDLSLLSKKDRDVVYGDAKLYREYIATSYNGGPSCPHNKKRLGLCAKQLFEKFAEFILHNPNEENRTYVRKMDAVAKWRRV